MGPCEEVDHVEEDSEEEEGRKRRGGKREGESPVGAPSSLQEFNKKLYSDTTEDTSDGANTVYL